MYERISSLCKAAVILYGGGCTDREIIKYTVERYIA